MTVWPTRFDVSRLRLPSLIRIGPRLYLASALLAGLASAALVVNFVVMPIIVRQGDLVAAPDLTGRAVAEARRVAEESGLSVRVVSDRPDPVQPANHVVSQSPPPGVDIKRRRTMSVVVSAGLDLKAVPAMAGLTTRQAELEAESAGLRVSEFVEAYSDVVERGRVVASYPDPGTALAAGSGVRVLVSRGSRPNEFIMPNLVGKTPDDARRVAEGLGLVVRSVKREGGRSRLLQDVVTVQQPAPGSRVIEGEGVALRVGKG